MPAPHHAHPGFHREFAWQAARPSDPLHRPRNEPEKIALPSIRQAFPELQLRVQPQDGGLRTPPCTTSPTAGTMTPPEYVHSPNQNKRRRLSFDDDREGERASQVPRLYASPSRMPTRQQSPPSAGPSRVHEQWGGSARSSPYMTSGALSSMEIRERREARPTLPSLPHLMEPTAAPTPAPMHRVRSHSGDDYMHEHMRPGMGHGSGPGMEAHAPAYRQASYGFGYHHPTRMQSLSLGSIHPFVRTPFSSAAYGHQFQDAFMRMSELGMGMSGDSKQRKRRGNLPKETTDKLRAWFVAHLHHPYPTEDEKQELMRQTGLQMNQISNWFINARRRQLPTMINNARAESDAMTGRGDSAKVLPSTERLDYEQHHDNKRRDSVPLSDGDASHYDEVDIDALSRRRASNMKRGSI
ncbi:homeobox domain-containing protein [Pseudomassariella vexata]|uniref:Homeobox domain-containing protein n=1 Tax=Pseudomassariella vexata TaxID=1141098 RepID=A0A1Y2EE57_9PEZI|nr:homeobox domain-containing protein [Pseudomassariella vexata]ORY69852.1 homeobox domain-containing protein [Pseudomassariella vexata]